MLSLCAAAFLTNLQDAVIKAISGSYPFHEMQSVRCVVAVMVAAVYARWQGGIGRLAGRDAVLVFCRGLVLGIASALFYLCAVGMTVASAVALYFTMPLAVAGLAGPMLGERVGIERWLAVLTGFGGLIVMLRPGGSMFEPAALYGLGAAACYAVGNLLTRPVAGAVPPGGLVFWQSVMYLAVALGLAALFGTGHLHSDASISLGYLTRGWISPSPLDALLFVLIGFGTGILMVLYTLAYRLAEASFIAPFEYTSMLWAVLFGWLVFHQGPDRDTLAGTSVICLAGLFLLRRERRTRRAAGR
jgi:drug/metabolite transporter (DMT)-like permease